MSSDVKPELASSLQVQKTERWSADSLPAVSVILPVRNEEAHIARTLGQLLEQQSEDFEFELLVVDGRSTDKTRQIVADLADADGRIRLLDNPGRLSSSARNVGLKAAGGDLVVVIDGHCDISTRTYLRDLIQAFDTTDADCLGRPQPLEIRDPSRLQSAIAAARSSPLGHHPASFIYSNKPQRVPAESVATAYRKEVFQRVGLFDESFDACEDVELNHRVDQAGLTCYLVPELKITYHPRTTLRGLFAQLMRYGRGRVRLWRKHPDTFSIGVLIPAALVVYCVAGIPIAFSTPWLVAFWGLGLGVYLAAVLIGSLAAAWRERSFWTAVLLPIVFMTIHAGAGIGVLLELSRPGTGRGFQTADFAVGIR